MSIVYYVIKCCIHLTRDHCWHCIAHQRQLKNTAYAYSGQVNQKQLESSNQCVHVYTV